jgi:hypothetical protein
MLKTTEKKKNCRPKVRIPKGLVIMNSVKQQKHLINNESYHSSSYSNSFNYSNLL